MRFPQPVRLENNKAQLTPPHAAPGLDALLLHVHGVHRIGSMCPLRLLSARLISSARPCTPSAAAASASQSRITAGTSLYSRFSSISLSDIGGPFSRYSRL